MKSFLKSLFWMSIIGLGLASFLPHLFPNYGLTDIFSHFKLQYIILLLLLLLSGFYIQKRRFSIVFILILLIWNSWFIFPLFFSASPEKTTPTESISVLSLNLLASNTNYSEALDLIAEKDAEVVVLLELSPQWESEMQVLYKKYPYRFMHPQNNNFGIGVLSKKAMTSELIYLGKDFPPSILSRLQINDKIISILATHPVPPVSQEMFELRNLQLEEIADLRHREAENFIVIGDLNTSSYSEHFKDLLKKGDLRDSRKGFGIQSSWPADIYPLRTTLDHCLISGELQVMVRSTEKDIGSDHLPVFVELGI